MLLRWFLSPRKELTSEGEYTGDCLGYHSAYCDPLGSLREVRSASPASLGIILMAFLMLNRGIIPRWVLGHQIIQYGFTSVIAITAFGMAVYKVGQDAGEHFFDAHHVSIIRGKTTRIEYSGDRQKSSPFPPHRSVVLSSSSS